ncbi:MAG: Glu/Leu/Phe/Val dehydrogenase [Candidatus Marinimicrobia bacterium]|nr:Glu/Leu/Phe/Val dehydrogenase [Candidatus Neomarinimicrobiota bacterium]
MEVFESMESRGHEQVVFSNDPITGLKAIIAIHDTTLGPALGGCRMWNYKKESDALRDVLRLSKGMTYKAAVAGLDLGGGKSVIIGDSKTMKNEYLFRSFGRFVQGLGGRYITAEDVGTSVSDMEWVRRETKYVTGISRALGGSGDPSPVTALGTFTGMKACVNRVFGSDSLKDRKIAIQGIGHVGAHLVDLLHKAGAKLYISDIDEEKLKPVAKKYGCKVVNNDKIYELDVDIFAPCAMGGIINDETIPKLKCAIIAGAANNQLEKEKKHGKDLLDKGILYAPDYVINAGGLINVYNELQGYNRERALTQAEDIYQILTEVLDFAEREGVPTPIASNRYAEERIKGIRSLKKTFIGEKKISIERRKNTEANPEKR